MLEAEKQQFNWVKPNSPIPEIYTNFAHASWSLYDVRFLLGQLKPQMSDSKEFVIEERGAVTLSWPHLKEIAKIINGMVASYEEANGEIKPLTLPAAPGAE